ncbi:MAG TPA: hypothetical protein VIN56_10260 [Candidatus Dormibacteraeota bacterium]
MLNVFLVLALATAVLLAIVSGARPAHALPPDFTVNTTTDENLTLSTNTLCVSPSGCSLRAALEAADNRGAVATTISVPFLSGTYNLDPTLGALQVGAVAGETVTVTGNIDPTITMAGCTETLTLSCMIFFVDPSGNGGVTVTLSSITISGGHTALGGGGILGGSLTATPDVLTVSNCTITGNSATGGGNGGGISFAHGSLTVNNCGFNANHATGGGNGGGIDFADSTGGDTLSVTNSSFSSNTSDATLNGGGGAIHLLGVGSNYAVTDSLFQNNTALNATAPGGGGAILKDSGALVLTGSNFIGNSAGAAGAGGAVNSESDASNLGDGVTPGLNRFAGSIAAAGSGQSLFRDTGNVGVVTAEENWWGTNTPNTSDAAKNVALTKWLVLGLSANPVFLLPGGATSLTGDLSHDNGGATPGIVSMVILPIPVSWPGPTGGNISGAATQLNGSAQAGATYTATGAAATVGTASVQVDGQTVTINIPILGPITISKAFGAATLPLNGSTSLTFTLTNPNPITTITGIAFSDNLPAGLVVATPNGLGGSCVATSTAIAGSSSITVSAVTLAGGASCTFAVNVTGTTAGTKNNTTGTITSVEGGTGGTASASIDVEAPPTIAKAFGAAAIAPNGTTTLTFTLGNPGGNPATLTGVGFTDTLPAGLVVATPNGIGGTCNGAQTAVAGSNTVSDSGTSIASGASCTVVVNVTGTTSGVKNNSVLVTSTNGGAGSTANASLTVAAPPTITKSFGAATIPVGGSTSLTFSIDNPNASVALTGVGFNDNLPAGLVVATPNGASGPCVGNGILTAAAGSGSIMLSGTSLAASANCTFSVSITGTTAGVKNNSTQVASTEGGTGNTTNASITVVSPPVIIKVFGAASILLNGSTSLTFTIQNNNTTTTLTGVGFSDTLPAGLVVSTPNGLTGGCGGGTITATQATSLVSLTGASIPASSSCTFAVNVTGTTGGTQDNTTGNVTSTEGGTGGTASSSINVVAPPSIAKAFGATHIAINGTTSLSFTISNPAANTVSLTGVGFTDTLPVGLIISTPNGLAGSCGGGVIVATAGTGTISLAGATLASDSSCTFSVNITGSASANYTNTTSAVSSTNGGAGNTGSANLVVADPPTITVTFNPTSIALNGTTTFTITITNPAGNTMALTGVGFNNPPAGLQVGQPNNLVNTCGGTATAVPGSSTLTLSGDTVAVASSCSFSVTLVGVAVGTWTDTVTVFSDQGLSGAVSASVDVLAATPNSNAPARSQPLGLLLGLAGLLALLTLFGGIAMVARRRREGSIR